MKSSCIQHPAKEPLIIIREWQIEFCKDSTGKPNRCAAALLSFYEYWHNIKLEQQTKAKTANNIAENHGDTRTQDESLYQFHTQKDLEQGILGLYGKTKIAEANQLLVDKNAISIYRNPNPRYKFDKTNHFLFHADVINEWLKMNERCPEMSNGKPKTSNSRTKMNKQYPETSSETSSERGKERALPESPNGSKEKPPNGTSPEEWPARWESYQKVLGFSKWRPVDQNIWVMGFHQLWQALRKKVGYGDPNFYPTEPDRRYLDQLILAKATQRPQHLGNIMRDYLYDDRDFLKQRKHSLKWLVENLDEYSEERKVA